MIGITTIASGSSGNCYHISDGETQILIECGIPFKKIQQALSFQTSKLSGCLISHSHNDHCKAINDVSRAGIDCYISETTKEEINISGHRIHTFKSKELFKIGTFKVFPLPLQHDVENHGFVLTSKNGNRLMFCTDTYFIRYVIADVNYYMVECNYSETFLQENIANGTVSKAIRNRIVESHFELENVKEFFRKNDMSQVKEIHLIHLSGTNADPEFFKQEIQGVSGKPVYVF